MQLDWVRVRKLISSQEAHLHAYQERAATVALTDVQLLTTLDHALREAVATFAVLSAVSGGSASEPDPRDWPSVLEELANAAVSVLHAHALLVFANGGPLDPRHGATDYTARAITACGASCSCLRELQVMTGPFERSTPAAPAEAAQVRHAMTPLINTLCVRRSSLD